MRTQPHENLVGPVLPWSPYGAIEVIADHESTDEGEAAADASTRKSVWYWTHRPSAPFDVVAEVHDLMSAAAELERCFDFTAASARARDAAALVASIATEDDGQGLADDVALAQARIDVRVGAWRSEVERRAATYSARERAAAEGPDTSARRHWRNERSALRVDRAIREKG